jgi:hypothetical protein
MGANLRSHFLNESLDAEVITTALAHLVLFMAIFPMNYAIGRLHMKHLHSYTTAEANA